MNENSQIPIAEIRAMKLRRNATKYPWAEWAAELRPGYGKDVSDIMPVRSAAGIRPTAAQYGLTMMVANKRPWVCKPEAS